MLQKTLNLSETLLLCSWKRTLSLGFSPVFQISVRNDCFVVLSLPCNHALLRAPQAPGHQPLASILDVVQMALLRFSWMLSTMGPAF